MKKQISERRWDLSIPMRVMVLKYKPLSYCSFWMDHEHRCRSYDRLIQQLTRRIRKQEIVGYRLITVHKEVIGNKVTGE
jgi:hypothetical protein